MRDKSSDERFAFDQRIQEREHQMDELNRCKHTIRNLLENLRIENRKWMSRMQDLNDSVRNEVSIQWQQDEIMGKYQHIERLADNEEDELNHQFSQSMNQLEDSRVELQQERNQLPWD